jgi:uncharacterized MAPEG superfamily protein
MDIKIEEVKSHEASTSIDRSAFYTQNVAGSSLLPDAANMNSGQGLPQEINSPTVHPRKSIARDNSRAAYTVFIAIVLTEGLLFGRIF